MKSNLILILTFICALSVVNADSNFWTGDDSGVGDGSTKGLAYYAQWNDKWHDNNSVLYTKRRPITLDNYSVNYNYSGTYIHLYVPKSWLSGDCALIVFYNQSNYYEIYSYSKCNLAESKSIATFSPFSVKTSFLIFEVELIVIS